MSMKVDLGKVFFLILFLTLSIMAAMAGTIRGTVVDKLTKEPLTGATVQIEGSTLGTIADIDGKFVLEVNQKACTLLVRYVGYKDISLNCQVNEQEATELLFEMETDAQTLNEVAVVARKNLEGEKALQMERQKATLAIENLGAKEMGIKGIGNVQEGVKKLTGISIADAGQLIVRGLGDRYSITTLNGMPIASPNPDNKLIPLDLFPTSTVQNITVSKVYDAQSFADYSGAHIDISTKENVTDDFLQIGVHTGGTFGTIGTDRWQMDRKGTLFGKASVDNKAMNMALVDFDEYVKTKNIFDTSFDVKKKTALPDLGGSVGFGKNFNLGSQTLTVLASASLNNSFQNMENCFYKTLESQGNVLDNFTYHSYAQHLEAAALGHIGYTLRKSDRIGYTVFYVRRATDTFQRREGIDSEGHDLLGTNNVTHIYTLQNHQLNGIHRMGADNRWELDWSGAYSLTSSEEPDRRQVMYNRDEDGNLSLFKLNRQETMRYYGSLEEKEWNAHLDLKWKWGEENFVAAGADFKDKTRDYEATRFYYNLNKLNPEIQDPYNTEGFLNQTNVSDGNIVIQRIKQPKDSYKAGNRIYAAYLTTDFYPTREWLVNIGLRYEKSEQWVRYSTDGGDWYSRRRDLNQHDLFPTLNMKYTFNKEHSLRLAASRTVTRPSFVEMAPFLYQESYGSAQIRGNEDLKNGYNYNFDLRYEYFRENGDMFSVTGYFKYLESPIERTQALQGGATLHSFQNADNGMAGGVEAEVRKLLYKDLRIGANVSYMYTNVKLPQGGAYTNKERPLQGASPILVNADLTYSPKFGEDRQMNVALLYNLQGKRIQSVGIAGLGDVKQDPLHTLHLNIGYQINKHLSVKAQFNDLLNRAVIFKQEVPANGSEIEVERYKPGSSFEVGINWKL